MALARRLQQEEDRASGLSPFVLFAPRRRGGAAAAAAAAANGANASGQGASGAAAAANGAQGQLSAQQQISHEQIQRLIEAFSLFLFFFLFVLLV